MPLPGTSVEPAAVTVADAAFLQTATPPVTVGSAGAVRSMRMGAAAVPAAGVQAPTAPEPSTARNCTSVSPSAETVRPAPPVAADHDVPPFVEVRYSYPERPLPASVDPDAVSDTDGTFCHDREPPDTVGAEGALRSMRTVDAAAGTAGVHADVLPAPSMLRSCTRVSPSAEIVAVPPPA